ncbi:porin [Treponema succinifaciens]|uniref:porin n=2 Tax=Treponema succinifaciens TaxID=167 RepID=UPI003F7D99E4
MKKTLIAVAAAAALTATSAFAEITFGAWLRSALIPVAYDGEDYLGGLTQSWGGAARTAVLGVNGVSEDGMAGFTFEIRNQAGEGINMGDRTVTWLKPIEQLKLSVGKFDGGDNGFREGTGFGAWNWVRPSATTGLFFNGDDSIMDATGGDGFMAEIFPIEGFKVMVNVPFLRSFDDSKLTKANAKAYDIYKKTQIGAAYTIDGTGTLKVLWTGVSEESKIGNSKYDYTGKIGVAFDLTAVENLYLAIGAKFDIVDEDYKVNSIEIDDETGINDCKDWGGAKNKAYFALNASYKVSDAITFNMNGGVKLFKESGFDPKWGIGAGVDYVIMEGLTLNADVRYISETKYSKNGVKIDGNDDSVSFLIGATKTIGSNGNIGIGFQGATNGSGFSAFNAYKNKTVDGYTKAGYSDNFAWCVPVMFNLSF